MKVLYLDPRGVDSTGNYTKGLTSALSSLVDLTVITNYYFEKPVNNSNYHLIKGFFRVSEHMKKNTLRKITRGIEYIFEYKKIISYINKNHFNIIHINWLLFYTMDIRFLKTIKRILIKRNDACKIVYTAHNVLPHVNGTKSIEQLRKIYNLVDVIILHGESIKKEFVQYFPEYESKVFIQYHGANENININYNINKIDKKLIDEVSKFNKHYIYFGNIFFNKGLDILLNIWCNSFKASDIQLISAGRITEKYESLEKAMALAKQNKNVLILDHVDDNTLNYLINISSLIIMPYRHASMSGVVFTAADFSKTVLTTDKGAIKEYLVNNYDSFIVTENQLENQLKKISVMDNKDLEQMGARLHEDIYSKFSWHNIAVSLVNQCYLNTKS